MFQKMLQVGNGGGGENHIKFELKQVNSNLSINNSDCYLYNDNGTLKTHIDIDFTYTGTIPSNYILFDGFPIINTNNLTGSTPPAPFKLSYESSRWRLFNSNSGNAGNNFKLQFEYAINAN